MCQLEEWFSVVVHTSEADYFSTPQKVLLKKVQHLIHHCHCGSMSVVNGEHRQSNGIHCCTTKKLSLSHLFLLLRLPHHLIVTITAVFIHANIDNVDVAPVHHFSRRQLFDG